MPNFSYVALDQDGRKVRGTITAANDIDLEERLSTMSLDLITCREVKESSLSFLDNVGDKDLIVFCVHLEQLDRAGVPILDSIEDLRDTTKSEKMRNIIADIYERVKSGDVLSAALARHPKVFNTIFVSLVQAGEKTGNLYEVFHHLTNHLKWVSKVKKRIRKATYYPSFLLALMIGILSLMMLFVVPQLSSFLTSQDFDLPVYTTALIATSDFFGRYWYMIIPFPVFVVVMIKLMKKFVPGFSYYWDAFKLKLPLIGSIVHKTQLARFCHFFSIMYRSGIGILECMDIAASVVDNLVIKQHISNARKSVAEGNSLTLSLSASGQFPSLVVRMFKVGEESGKLDITLENVNFFYDEEVSDGVDALVGAIQPALTILMGGLMLWMSLAVFGPLYDSFSQMSF